MPNYNFLNLSPTDFEDLSRDLIQKNEGIILESFTIGRDGGVDSRLRYSNTNQLIIQSKRYTKFSDLFTNLEKEVGKLKKLKPKRYILSTTVGLTPLQKKRIYDLFKGYIKDEKDIIHREDLNNLLGLYPEIERQHFKLWLSSISILRKITNGHIETQTTFEEEEIKENLKLYVKNDSFNEAISILDEYKFVIISGIPGIGKTTLARILLFYFLGQDNFKSFTFLSSDITEGLKVFDECDLFFFDDFLGRNLLRTLSGNEEKRIIQFLKKIQKSKNKRLIITTRDYILNQGKIKFEDFNNPLLENGKCILDLSKYTPLIKAQILYNHLFYSQIPDDYKRNLIEHENYLKIITHRNYNPRIIEQLTSKKEIWSQFKPNDFFNSFIDFLDTPLLVWKHIFEQQLSELSKNILLRMILNDDVINGDVVFESVTKYFASKGAIQQKIEFKNSLKKLEGTFLKIEKPYDNNEKTIYLEFQNPSIVDYLLNYINNNPVVIPQLIEDTTSLPQLLESFRFDKVEREHDWRIYIDGKIKKVWTKKVLFLAKDWVGGTDEDKMMCLSYLVNYLSINFHPKIKKFVHKYIKKINLETVLGWDSVYLNIMFELSYTYEINWAKITKIFYSTIDNFEGVTGFSFQIWNIYQYHHDEEFIYDLIQETFEEPHGKKFLLVAQAFIELKFHELQVKFRNEKSITKELKDDLEKKFNNLDLLFIPKKSYLKRLQNLIVEKIVLKSPDSHTYNSKKEKVDELTPEIKKEIYNLFEINSLTSN